MLHLMLGWYNSIANQIHTNFEVSPNAVFKATKALDDRPNCYCLACWYLFAGKKFISFGIRVSKRVVGHKCPGCSKPMRLVKDEYDENFLLPYQATEEELGSVSYDVYVCMECKKIIKIGRAHV